ncbi:hypothetical protein Pfo_016655, partial [Paulownia fortunei]
VHLSSLQLPNIKELRGIKSTEDRTRKKMEAASEKNKVGKDVRAPFSLHNPCNYFQKIIRAMLRCCGLESAEPQNSCSNAEDETSSQSSASSADHPPPSSAADPTLDPPSGLTRLGNTSPPPPTIDGGKGAQNNANSS